MRLKAYVIVWILPGLFSAAFTMAGEAGPAVAETSPAPAKLSLFDAVVLGAVEGATEFLPVSSTGHLILVQQGLGIGGGDSDAADALAICIQLGAILAVLWLYVDRIRQVLRGILGGDPNGLRLFRNLIIAFLPSAVLGLVLHDWIKQHLFAPRPVAGALFVGGLLILATARRIAQRGDRGSDLLEMTSRDALRVGLLQCLAFWPGFSRSLAAILGCLWTGMRLSAAVEFSFLLGLVTLSAATVYEGLQSGGEIVAHYGVVFPLTALLVAFLSAIVSVRFLIHTLNKYGLGPFGYYRILLAGICVLWL